MKSDQQLRTLDRAIAVLGALEAAYESEADVDIGDLAQVARALVMAARDGIDAASSRNQGSRG